MRIVLASGSPRRRQLLAQVGLDFDVVVSDADETIDGAPYDQVATLARRKAEATLDLMVAQGNGGGASGNEATGEVIIIAADTLVALEDGGMFRVLGKPADAGEAFEMLSALAGRKHTVHTGVAILRVHAGASLEAECGECTVFVVSTDVYFRPLTDAQVHAYIATGEPFDKAGAYGIQEKGALLVERVHGDFYTVMGLPIARLCLELEKMGVPVWGK